MKRLLWVICAVCALTMVACGPSRTKMLNEIAAYEDSLKTTGFMADNELATQLATRYVAFANKFPEDSLAATYLYRASDLYLGVDCLNGSMECLDRLIADYPDFDEFPTCYYMRGYVLECMDSVEAALAAYNLFLELYPNHPLAESTRQALPYVGMDPEEMLEMILSNASIENIVEE